MQYLKYPTKVMGISQSYKGGFSHLISSTGNPKSYPIDETCGSSARDYFYAPCDLLIKRIYGVGNRGTNTVWMESKEKVKLANGTESYVTIMVVHPNDDTLKQIKVGQSFKQGDPMFLEGKDGNATGYHFHIEVANCKYSELKSKGWLKNSKNAWVISNNAIKPEDAFYVDKSFTKIKNSGGLTFKEIPVEVKNNKPVESTQKFKIGDLVIINGALYSSSNSNTSINNVTNKTTKITRYSKGAKHPYNTTGDLGWMDEASIKLAPSISSSKPVELKVGDNVTIVASGNSQANGKGVTAKAIGSTRKILKIYKGSAYPYQVGDKTGVTGFYKEVALKKK